MRARISTQRHGVECGVNPLRPHRAVGAYDNSLSATEPHHIVGMIERLLADIRQGI
jgi:hypothetical protein